jgi:hypothetical protein
VLDELKKSNVTKNKKMMAWKKDVTPEALVWAMFDLPKTTKPKQKNPMMAGPENVEGGMLSLSMKGKDKKDIDLDLVLECKDQQTSGMMLMQAKMLIGCLAMSSSQNNPELAMELNKAIVINSEGKNLKAKVSLPKSLQDKLKMFSGGNPTLLPPGVGGQKQPELPVFKPTETKKGE